MGKRRRKKKEATRISPASTLRPRLDNLWAESALLHKDDGTIEDDLDVVARGVAPDLFVKTMLFAYVAASAPVRARLDGVLPRWLSRHNCLGALKEMVAGGSLGDDLRSPALAWMEAAGVDTRSLESSPSSFHQAYYYDDAALRGEKSQAYVAVFWYPSPRKNRAQGICFLLDYNPPWDGSVKDILVAPRRRPKRLVGVFWKYGPVEGWSQSRLARSGPRR